MNLREWLSRKLCSHPEWRVPSTAHHKMNWGNEFKVYCATCGKKDYFSGGYIALHFDPLGECHCSYKKKGKK